MQLNAIPIHQRLGDVFEDGIHHRLDVPREQVRVLRCDAGDELGSDHVGIETTLEGRSKIRR
ncbi:hypothetical protein [Methylobacterium brachiatum]|uniref:Uncharacterized protein n=1 Tax=Methylobacterium brachiatum TaxID=269660 RepID=A0ABV1RAZ4_9HYPH